MFPSTHLAIEEAETQLEEASHTQLDIEQAEAETQAYEDEGPSHPTCVISANYMCSILYSTNHAMWNVL